MAHGAQADSGRTVGGGADAGRADNGRWAPGGKGGTPEHQSGQ